MADAGAAVRWEDWQESLLISLVSTHEYKDIAARLNKSVGSICSKVSRLKAEGLIRTPTQVQKTVKVQNPPTNTSTPDYLEMRSILDRLEVEASERGDLVTLAKRQENNCCYPVDDTGKSLEVYCGHKAIPGSSYCQEHHRRMYSDIPLWKPKTKKRELELVQV